MSTIAKNLSEHYKTEITNGNHVIIADEPILQGGKNLGFSPTPLLEASLASCTAITIRMYASRKNWPLEEVEVEVKYNRDLLVPENSFIKKKVTFKGELDEEQISRLKTIGGKCPIHKLLQSGIEIKEE